MKPFSRQRHLGEYVCVCVCVCVCVRVCVKIHSRIFCSYCAEEVSASPQLQRMRVGRHHWRVETRPRYSGQW
jgi:hypothetical protein